MNDEQKGYLIFMTATTLYYWAGYYTPNAQLALVFTAIFHITIAINIPRKKKQPQWE